MNDKQKKEAYKRVTSILNNFYTSPIPDTSKVKKILFKKDKKI